MTDLILSDNLQFKEQVVEGIEQTLSAFLTLFDGSNTGKLIVDLTGSN
jgi:NADPH-dependent curcumin reductase CurA